jgi:hypothetical protein
MSGVDRRMPYFFIVGHSKSGTTALFELLRRHPRVFLPDCKEPLFFSRELHPTLRDSSDHAQTLAEYLSLFDDARGDQRIGEASSTYLRSHVAARRIAELRPDARIIAILREPASFLRSLHFEMLQDHVETDEDLHRALRREDARRQEDAPSSVPPGYIWADRVSYVQQLRRFHAVFPADQVKVIIYDDFKTDNAGVVQDVLAFLGVDTTIPIAPLDENPNPTVRVRSLRLYRLVRALTVGDGVATATARQTIKALTSSRLRRRVLQIQRRAQLTSPGPPDEELIRHLQHRFKHEVVALGDYLGRDLVKLWGYEQID